MWAKCGCPLGDYKMRHDRPTAPAGQAGPTIGEEVGLVVAGAAVCIDVVAQGGPAGADGACEGLADGPAEAAGLLAVEGASRLQRVDSGAKEGLVGIDVADAGDDLLIEQRRFDRPAGGGQGGSQVVVADGQRIGPEPGPVDGLQRSARIEGGQPAESTRIAEDQAVARRVCGEAPDDVEVIFAGWLAACGKEDELAAHAQLHEQRRGIPVGDDGELLAMAAQFADAAAFQQRAAHAHGRGSGNAQMLKADHVVPRDVHSRHGAAKETGGECAEEMFDFGKFGHDGG